MKGPSFGSKRDHVTTYLAEGITLVATVLVYKLAADRLGDLGFEQYTVVRRTTSFIQMIGMLGLAVGIVRFVAMAGSKERQVGLLHVAIRKIGIVSLIVLVPALVLPGQLASVFFGTSEYASLIAPIALLVIGLMFHTLGHGYLRGCGRMGAANLLQVINIAIVPNAAMFLFVGPQGGGIEAVLWGTAWSWSAFSGVALLIARFAAKVEVMPFEASRMVRFGMLRLPGDVVFASLLSVPVFVVNHVEGLTSGAGLAFAITLVNVAGAVYTPLSLILLPSIAALLMKKDWKQLLERIKRAKLFVVVTALLMVAVFEVVATPLLEWYLGDVGVAITPICRIAFIAAFFFGIFVALRSVLDAYYHGPRNTFNLFWAFLVFVCVSALYWTMFPFWWFAPWLVVAPMALLAFLTWRDTEAVSNDLRMDQQGIVRPTVLEPISGKGLVLGSGSSVWKRLSISEAPGLFAMLKNTRLLRKAERELHPRKVLVADDPRMAIAIAATMRAPLVLVSSGTAPAIWDKWAALFALLVVCTDRAAEERIGGWATRTIVVDQLQENGILAALNKEEEEQNA